MAQFFVGTQFNDSLPAAGLNNSGDDTLNGTSLGDLTPGFNELDTLEGGFGADIFVLGDSRGPFYLNDGGAGFAIINDFIVSDNDFIQLAGNPNNFLTDYALVEADFGVGSGASRLDTGIYFNNNGVLDPIAVVADATGLNQSDFIFTGGTGTPNPNPNPNPNPTGQLFRGTEFNDSLPGAGLNNGGDDTLDGTSVADPTPGLNELDTLEGGFGADTFVLGDSLGSYYINDGAAGFAIINDFIVSDNDLIQVFGNSNNFFADYALVEADFGFGGTGTDTGIYINNGGVFDPIAVVADATGLNQNDFIFNNTGTPGTPNPNPNPNPTGQLFRGTEFNDSLPGAGLNNSGNDTLDGTSVADPTPGFNELDTLEGGFGADTFVLGDSLGSYYINDGAAGFAIINDFIVSDNDFIQVSGLANNFFLDYALVEADFGVGGTGTDTGIYIDNNGVFDPIAVVADVTALNQNDFIFV